MKKLILFVAMVLLLAVSCEAKARSLPKELSSDTVQILESALGIETDAIVMADSLAMVTDPSAIWENEDTRHPLAGRLFYWSSVFDIAALVLVIALFVSVVMILVSAAKCQKRGNAKYSWQDLGLPSGLLWKSVGEKGLYSFDEATEKFSEKEKVPSVEDWRELCDCCRWTWKWLRRGYVVTGPNGNSIFLPTSGFYDSEHRRNGIFWSSSLDVEVEGHGYVMAFNRKVIDLNTVSDKANMINVWLCCRPAEEK